MQITLSTVIKLLTSYPSGLIWPILILGGAAIGWLVTSPPPVQAPTKDGEAVFPPLDIGE